MSDLARMEPVVSPGGVVLDLSKYQGEPLCKTLTPTLEHLPKIRTALAAALAAGALGFYFRAGEGRLVGGKLYQDPYFELFAIAATELGANWGAYYRYKPTGQVIQPACDQAKHFLNIVYRQETKFLPNLAPVLDWERFVNWGEPMLHPYAAMVWMQIVNEVTLTLPMLYTSAAVLQSHTTVTAETGTSHEWILNYRVWLAHYPWRVPPASPPRMSATLPIRPTAMRRVGRMPALWQYTGSGLWSGFAGAVDLNVTGG